MAGRKADNLLNYRTRVEASQTAGEIVTMLAGKKVSSINMDYQNGKIEAITFVTKVGDNMIPFRLQPNVQGAFNRREVASQGREQAERVAWRIVLRWVEAQMAMVECGQAEIGQVFLPYAVRANGDTFWQAFQMSNTKQLTAGE